MYLLLSQGKYVSFYGDDWFLNLPSFRHIRNGVLKTHMHCKPRQILWRNIFIEYAHSRNELPARQNRLNSKQLYNSSIAGIRYVILEYKEQYIFMRIHF